MNKEDYIVFKALFKNAYKKCFKNEIKSTLTEADSNYFSSEILEKTGLVIGWKSLKNYSSSLLSSSTIHANPTLSTLDTLARYVLDAAKTDEFTRKKKENNFNYWYQYKEEYYRLNPVSRGQKREKNIKQIFISAIILLLIISGFIYFFLYSDMHSQGSYSTRFTDISADRLKSEGWFLQSMNGTYWKRRGEKKGVLTLFTLRGDNWPESGETPKIENILMRKISSECFTAEVHLTEFFPKQNWQQAGIIISEDTTFKGKSLRLSIGYNDFSGGFPSTRVIKIQAIKTIGNSFNKPEEIADKQLFTITTENDSIIAENLKYSALRIEKKGKYFRLLYSNGQMKNSAFIEASNSEFDMEPRYIGIFALKGFTTNSKNIPVYFDFFRFVGLPCN